MALSKKLISQFAKTINELDHKEPEQRTLYGTAVLYDRRIYVQLDGSQQLTPLEDRIAGVSDGDRVTCVIENHSARITGNLTDPAANISIVEGLEGQINTFDTIIANKADIDELNAAIGRITDLEADNVTITGKLEAAEADITDLTAENVTITGRLDVNEANVDTLTASVAKIDDLVAEKADIDDLEATNATITNLQADIADIEELTAQKADISDLNAMNANITNLLAQKADIDDLNAVHATIEDLDATKADIVDLDAIKADIVDLDATKADIESLDAQYANIDFANIGMAAVEELFAKSGIIEDMVVGDQHITGHLVGVTISGDLIEGNTIKADKLVVQGTDGLYYKLNISGETVAAEQTDYNSLNGSVITAHSITAEKVNVDDLVAFNADIGGYHIADGKLYSGAKTDVNNTTRGVYLGSDSQVAIGDANNYLKFFKDPKDSKWKLIISASSILMGGGDSVEDAISNAGKLTDRKCGEQPYVFGKNGGRAPYELKVYGQTRQNLWELMSATNVLGVTIVNNADGSVTLSGATTSNNVWLGYKPRYVLRPGSTYTLSVDNAIPSGMGFRVESRDADNVIIAGGILEVDGSKKTATVTLPSNTAYVNYLFYSVAPAGTSLSGTYRIMLNEGSEAQPWCPPGLNGVDELSVVTAGKNLYPMWVDSTQSYITPNDDGTFTVNSGSYRWHQSDSKYPLSIKAGTTLVISDDFDFPAPVGFGCFFLAPDGATRVASVNTYGSQEKKVTLSSDVGYIRPYFNMASTVTKTGHVQLEIGDEPTEWEKPQITTTPIDLDGHALNSLPDGTRDELTVDASGNVTLVQRVGDATLPSSAPSWQSNGGRFYAGLGQAAAKPPYTNGSVLSDALPSRRNNVDNAYDGTHIIAANWFAYANVGTGETAQTIASVCGNKTLLYALATPETISLGKVSLPAVPADAATIWYSVPTGLTPEGCVELWTEEGAKVADAQLAADAAAQGAIASQTVAYQLSSQGTNPPTGTWLPTMPTPVKGQYLWTRVITVFVSGKTSTDYTVAYQGKDGAKGDQGVQGPKGEAGADGKDGTNGKDGTSVTVTSTSVTYQKSTSGTTIPTGTWSTTIPSVSAGQYLWSRTIVNYSNGTSTTTYNPSRSGTNGANGTNGTNGKDGADGNGIKSTSITYQAHSSQTTAPTGSWTTSIPKLSAAKPYLWTRTILTFDDTTTKTLYSVSSTLEGVEVGGRNLLYGTNNGTKSWSWSLQTGSKTVEAYTVNGVNGVKMTITATNTGWNYIGYSNLNPNIIELGEMYTFSLDVYTNVAGRVLSFSIRDRDGSSPLTVNGSTVALPANKWTKVSATVTAVSTEPDSRANNIVYILGAANGVGSYYIFKNLKLERGNKATDWTPAPEDVEADIDEAAKTATNYLSFSSSTGLIITQNAASPSSGKNVQITSSAINIRNSTTVLSQFSESQILLGQSSSRNALINTNGVYLRSGTTNLASFTASAITLGQTSSDHVTLDSGRIEFWHGSSSLGVFAGGTTRLGVLTGMNSYFTSSSLQFRYGDTTVLGSITSNTLTLGKTNDSNAVINQNGVYLREATTNLAQFTSNAVILGKAASKHVVLTTDRLEFLNNTTSLGAFSGSELRLGSEGQWGYFYANASGAEIYDEDGASCVNIAAGTARIGKSNSYNTYITGSSIALRSSSTVLTSITASSITLGRTDGSYKNLYMTSSSINFRQATTTLASITPTQVYLGQNASTVDVYLTSNFHLYEDPDAGGVIERTRGMITLRSSSYLNLQGPTETTLGSTNPASDTQIVCGSQGVISIGSKSTPKIQIGGDSSTTAAYSITGIYSGSKVVSIASGASFTVLFTNSQYVAITGREYEPGDVIIVSNGDFNADGRNYYDCVYRGDQKQWYFAHQSISSTRSGRVNFCIICVHR